MSRSPISSWAFGLAVLACSAAHAVQGSTNVGGAPRAAVQPETVPSWYHTRSFEQLGRPADTLLLGVRNSEQIEFGLRHDRLATQADLQLDYTPSPALIPTLSHLRVYLNDELMGVLPVAKDDLGQRVRQQLPLDPKLIADFNQVRLEFVGHYTDICEDPAHSGLWLNLNRQSQVRVREQALVLENDLAYFPLPFFDARDTGKVSLPVVFSASPTLGEQRAAAILASYFGSLAGWRKATFPVLFDQLPKAESAPQPAIVFASNERRPAFLADLEKFPKVDGPVVQVIDHPESNYSKVLLVLGRDDADLLKAAMALAIGSDLFRGSRVKVEQVQELQPRQPYDAPNWTRTDRPVRFAELLDYPQQLQVSGLQPRPITLDLNLPPDLFVWRNQGIPLRTLYRYTPPAVTDESRLSLSVNEQYITSMALEGSDRRNSRVQELRLSVLPNDSTLSEKTLVPALKIGDRNRIRFDFSFASKLGSAQRDQCQTSLPVDVQAAIDEESTIDLSGYHHYIAMPDLRAFARSGFPFSRMADLSETLVLVPATPSALQVGTLLDVIAGLSGQIGYPALGLRLTDDWAEAKGVDADLLLLGPMPDGLRQEQNLNLLLDSSRDWLLRARAPSTGNGYGTTGSADAQPATRVDISARAPIAAIAGLRSPFHEQRSIVALLASQEGDYALLRDTMGDVGQLDAVAGSVAVIRNSGISSQLVGEQYFVGYLPWWLLLWFHLSEYPVLLAALAALSVVLLAFVLWRALGWAARRRLGQGQ